MIKTEHQEQVDFINLFKVMYRDVIIFAIPNGGLRHIAVAKKLKKEGVLSDVPDLFVPQWFLWIEMKKEKGGVLSEPQKKMISALKSFGYQVIIAYGSLDGIKKVQKFLKNN